MSSPLITLTGADDGIEPTELQRLTDACSLGSKRGDAVEWGILYSESKQGSGRYPSFAWIEQLLCSISEASRSSYALHVCGRAVHDFIDGSGYVTDLAAEFDRVQLNFRSETIDAVALRECIQRNNSQTIITQHNAANQTLWTLLCGIENHAILFDQSGGRGQSPAGWVSPLTGVLCGYAGGLGPDNLSEQLPHISAVAAGKPFWVDMESKLRDKADRFCLDRAASCLNIAEKFFASRSDLLAE